MYRCRLDALDCRQEPETLRKPKKIRKLSRRNLSKQAWSSGVTLSNRAAEDSQILRWCRKKIHASSMSLQLRRPSNQIGLPKIRSKKQALGEGNEHDKHRNDNTKIMQRNSYTQAWLSGITLSNQVATNCQVTLVSKISPAGHDELVRPTSIRPNNITTAFKRPPNGPTLKRRYTALRADVCVEQMHKQFGEAHGSTLSK